MRPSNKPDVTTPVTEASVGLPLTLCRVRETVEVALVFHRIVSVPVMTVVLDVSNVVQFIPARSLALTNLVVAPVTPPEQPESLPAALSTEKTFAVLPRFGKAPLNVAFPAAILHVGPPAAACWCCADHYQWHQRHQHHDRKYRLPNRAPSHYALHIAPPLVRFTR